MVTECNVLSLIQKCAIDFVNFVIGKIHNFHSINSTQLQPSTKSQSVEIENRILKAYAIVQFEFQNFICGIQPHNLLPRGMISEAFDSRITFNSNDGLEKYFSTSIDVRFAESPDRSQLSLIRSHGNLVYRQSS